MNARVLLLALPSLLILALLVVHSLLTMPRPRATAFWGSVAAYGVLRGIALRWVIEHGSATSFPYVIRDPLLPVLGVPLQEIAGWAIVTYLGWWMGGRLSRHLFPQVAWACLFLGAISWAVESAAVAAGWWSWSVPVTHPLFGNVPLIGIVDWLFVGIDFLLPFAALTSPDLARGPARLLALLTFPLHFAAHCFSDRTLGGTPIPIHHLVHWVLIATLAWLALRSGTRDEPFARGRAWLPLTGLGVVLAVAAAVELFLVRRPGLLVSILPAVALALQALRPALGFAGGAAALVLSLWYPPCILAAVPAATAGLLPWGRRHPRSVPIAAVALAAVLAYAVHSTGARRQEDLTRRLGSALAARDRGDLARARGELTGIAADFPGSHVPWALLGEIDYRTERLEEARSSFARAVEIKQDDVRAFRYLAVIDRRLGRKESAARAAARGLEVDGRDPELLYLAGAPMAPETPEAAQRLASLAFEVGDAAGAAAILERGLALWPEQRAFYRSRVNLALQGNDGDAARRVLAAWRRRFPHDPEARRLASGLGVE